MIGERIIRGSFRLDVLQNTCNPQHWPEKTMIKSFNKRLHCMSYHELSGKLQTNTQQISFYRLHNLGLASEFQSDATQLQLHRCLSGSRIAWKVWILRNKNQSSSQQVRSKTVSAGSAMPLPCPVMFNQQMSEERKFDLSLSLSMMFVSHSLLYMHYILHL